MKKILGLALLTTLIVADTIPSTTIEAMQPQCGLFSDMFQTRHSCGSSGGRIEFTNAGQTLDGSNYVIKNNPDNILTTCSVITPNWVLNQYQTCGEHGDCIASESNATALSIDYYNPPQRVNIDRSPASGASNYKIKNSNHAYTLTKRKYNKVFPRHGGITNYSVTFDHSSSTLRINKITTTKNDTFFFKSNNTYDLEIGSITIKSNGSFNTFDTDDNIEDIKIYKFEQSDHTSVTFKAQKTIKMEEFYVGRGSHVVLKAPYIVINHFEPTNRGYGNTIIEIYANYIDMDYIELAQNVTLKIHPFTPGKRILFRNNNITESSSSTILLSSGNYYINSDLVIPGTSDVSALRALDENQDIDFFLNHDLQTGNNPGINALGNRGNFGPFAPEKFRLYINGHLKTGGGGTTFNATIYVEGNVDFGNPTYVRGAINANDKVKIGQGQFIYDQNIAQVGWGQCGGSLVAEWRMDESQWSGVNGEVTDTSSNHLNGTAKNGATTTTGKICNGGVFDGIDDFIEIENSDKLDNTSKLTLTFWIYPTELEQTNGTNARGIISKRQKDNVENAYGVLFWNYHPETFEDDDGDGKADRAQMFVDIVDVNDRFHTNGYIHKNRWTFVAVVFDGTKSQNQRVQVYINGNLDTVAAESSTFIPHKNSNVAIGNLSYFGKLKVFKGKIDEVKIFKKALTAQQIRTIYNREKIGHNWDDNKERVCPFSPQLLIDWRFDNCNWEGKANEIGDYSGFDQNATPYNLQSRYFGVCKGAYFNGNSYVKLDHNVPDLSSYTLTGWIETNLTTPCSQQPIFLKGGNNAKTPSDIEIYLENFDKWRVNGNPYLRIVHNRDSSNNSYNAIVTNIPNNQKVHIAITYDKNTKELKVYVNGNERAIAAKFCPQEGYSGNSCHDTSNKPNCPYDFAPPNNSYSHIYLGKIYWYAPSAGTNFLRYYSGYMDELKIFNNPLNASQIQAIYNNEKANKNYDGTVRYCNVCELCYEDVEVSGTMCGSVGPCAGGVGCKKSVPIKNISDFNLTDIIVDYDESGLGGSFGNSCGVEPTNNGRCLGTKYNIDFGLWGLLGKATEFSIYKIDMAHNDNKVWTKNIVGMNCFGEDKFYARYKDQEGRLYRGKMKKCATTPPSPQTCGLRDFEIINPEETRNITGDYIITGNTIECVTVYRRHYGGDCTNDFTKNDNNYMVKYIDIDNNQSTWNSSSAYLQLPPNFKEIVWAAIFWQGNVNNYRTSYDQRRAFPTLSTSRGWAYKNITQKSEIKPQDTQANQILFKIEGMPQYIPIQAKKFDCYKYYDKYGFVYSAYSDITNIFRQYRNLLAPNKKLTLTVANITANEGREYSLGDYGAWSVVVIYRGGSNTKFKRILIYNGFVKLVDKVLNDGRFTKEDIYVSNLYLPQAGDVEAQMGVVAGEGEYVYKPDTMKLENRKMPGAIDQNNIFDARLANIQRPHIDSNDIRNANGIDIDIYDVSSIMTNVRDRDPDTHEVTLTLATDHDAFFPSVLTFSVELYRPKVCYEETLYDRAGNVINANSNLQIGDVVRAHLTIRNDDNEVAKKVVIYKKFDNNKTAYIRNSTCVQNVEETTERCYSDSSSLVEYTDENKTLKIGYLGSGNPPIFKPYSIDNRHIAYIDYNFTVLNEGTIELDYENSYIFEIAGQTFKVAGTLPKCTDFNNTVSVTSYPTGGFDAWDTFRNINDRNISTKIVSQNFQIQLVSLNKDNNGLEIKPGEIVAKYALYDMENDTNVTDWQDFNASQHKSKIASFNINKAIQEARIAFKFCGKLSANKMFLYPYNQCTQICDPMDVEDVKCLRISQSSDNFAIRPKRFDIDINASNTNLVAGERFQLHFKALDAGDKNTTDYNESIDNSFEVTYNELKAANGCTTSTFIPNIKIGWQFNNGFYAINSYYNEVGDINISIKEKNKCEQTFAKVDCDDRDVAGHWNKNTDLKISAKKITLSFAPHHFNLTTLLKDFSNFTYFSNDIAHMYALLDINITAKNANDQTTKNYNKECYAKKVDISISHSNPNIFSLNNLSYLYQIDTTPYSHTQPINQIINLTNIAKDIFSTDINGTGSLEIKFNLERNKTLPIKPLYFTINDINVSDENDVNGTATLEQNVTFVYGRIHGADESINLFKTREGNVTLTYEIFDPLLADGTRQSQNDGITILNGLPNSIDNINWVINTKHTSENMGKIYQIRHKNAVLLNSDGTTGSDDTLTLLQSYPIDKGRQIITLKNNKTHTITAKLDINASSWLIYNRFNPNAKYNSFAVKFLAKPRWKGVGSFHKQIEANESTINHYRINW